MENGRYMNDFIPQDGVIVGPSYGRGCTKSHADLADRRLKNRERQRRYRERKRLEAEAKKASSANPSVPNPAVVHPNGFLKEGVNRLYCSRDWKEDARRARASKEPALRFDGPDIPVSTLASGNVMSSLLSETETHPPLDWQLHSETSLSQSEGATSRVVLSRRDWKAEARNMKN